MQTQVKAWGNSQGVRLPKEALRKANIFPDEILEVKVSEGMIILEKEFKHRTLEERAQEFDGKLNLDGETDWGEAVGRELWCCG
ncbi:MAG: AbrB/MazE/SpoVT family DNA-binding domain-containing protein [Lachnospiraceae bacterium]|nr:AbrB/MazE/SpoVT family DNA-binding domain-containing protein [Lachnospiraceae bacterium]